MEPFASPAFGPAALAFVGALAWKSTLVLAAAFVAAVALARHSAALRHRVWLLATAALLALPFVQAAAPPLVAPYPAAQRAADITQAVPARPSTGTSATKSRSIPTDASPTPTPAPPPGVSWPALVLLAWLAGALAVLAFFAAGRVALARLARSARPLDDPEWRELAVDVAASLGLRTVPRFLVGGPVAAPLTWGILRPTILLPESAAAWPLAQRRAFLVHEMAHVVRRDCLVQDAAHAVCALYWFHPGAWFAAHRLRIEREPACDDFVLADGATATDYASHLLEIVRLSRVPHGAIALSGAAMASPSRLEERVRSLLDARHDHRPVGRAQALVATALALALLLPVAALAPRASTAADKAAATSRAPGTAPVDLTARWERALREGPEGHANGDFWFLYAIPFDGGRDGKEILLSDSDGWRADDLKPRGATLAERLGCGPQDAVILLRVSGDRAEGSYPIERVALRNGHLSPDLGKLPVIAIGSPDVEESFDWLRARLDEAPADERSAVLVSALSLHAGPRTLPLLVALLDGTREERVRTQAAEGLERHAGKPALDALMRHAREDRSQDVSRECAETIGDLDYAPATDALFALVRELDDEQVRAEAVESLGAREPARVLPVLVWVTDDDESETVRREAVETLGDLPGNAGLQALRKMAQHHADPAVRSEAVETLNDLALRAEKAARGD